MLELGKNANHLLIHNSSIPISSAMSLTFFSVIYDHALKHYFTSLRLLFSYFYKNTESFSIFLTYSSSIFSTYPLTSESLFFFSFPICPTKSKTYFSN